MEQTGVIGHDAEGDELAPEGKRSRMLMPCRGSVVTARMNYSVITIQTPLFFTNNQEIFEHLCLTAFNYMLEREVCHWKVSSSAQQTNKFPAALVTCQAICHICEAWDNSP